MVVCERHEVDHCVICNPPPGPDFRRGVRHKSLVASYEGLCPVCGEHIYAGDHIVRDPSFETWVHKECRW